MGLESPFYVEKNSENQFKKVLRWDVRDVLSGVETAWAVLYIE